MQDYIETSVPVFYNNNLLYTMVTITRTAPSAPINECFSAEAANDSDFVYRDYKSLKVLKPDATDANPDNVLCEFEKHGQLKSNNTYRSHTDLENMHNIIIASEDISLICHDKFIAFDEIIRIQKYYKREDFMKLAFSVLNESTESFEDVIIEDTFKIAIATPGYWFLRNETGLFSPIFKDYVSINAKLDAQ